MDKLLTVPSRTYTAKLFEVPWETNSFKIAGTLDGFIDLATPNGTYPLTLGEAKNLIVALNSSISDVEAKCLHDRDACLSSRGATTRLRELRRMLDQYPGQQGGLQAIAEELYRMARSPESFKCAARSANTGANAPQECDWPFCGCDPYADKVIAEIQEAGFTLVKDEDLLKMSSIHSEPESEPCEACGKPDGINHTYDCPEAQQ